MSWEAIRIIITSETLDTAVIQCAAVLRVDHKIVRQILEKHTIDGKVCFIENKEGGSIYDKDVIKIGEVKEGEFILYN